MAKHINRPDWYQDEFYNKIRTHEEWLYEIWKRDKFNREDLNLPLSIRLIPIEERKKCFLEVIFSKELNKFLSRLQATPSKPIQHTTVSDAFRMVYLILNSEKYKNHSHRLIFESAMIAITKEETLTNEQKEAFNIFYELPWHFFHKNSNEANWYPNEDIPYLSGVPISVDPTYAKENIDEQLSLFLNNWVGKLQDVELHFMTWQESKVLAVFDLIMWFKIQNIKFTKVSLHRLIWPKGRYSPMKNAYVNPDDDIEYSINLMEKVINQTMVRTLAIMCEAKKFKKETVVT